MDLNREINKAITDVVPFIMARWCRTGGFGFAPTLPPSVEDTYLALKTLEKTHLEAVPGFYPLKANRELRSFLIEIGDKETWRTNTAYQYLAICASCGVEPDQKWLKTLQARSSIRPGSLEDIYYLTKIRKELPNLLWSGDQGGSGKIRLDWSNAKNLRMCLYLTEGSASSLNATRQELIEWLRRCMNPDGGFGPTPGTTSFIEYSHWCLSSLALLSDDIPHAIACAAFVLSCRTRGGGFSRRNGAAPSLDATWHAVESLNILGTAINPAQ